MTAPAPRTLHLLTRRWGGGTETNVHRLVGAVPEFELTATEDVLGWPLDWARLPKALLALRRIRPEVVFCYGATAHLLAMMAWPLGTPLVGNIRCASDFAGQKRWIARMMDKRAHTWVSNAKATLGDRQGVVVYNGISEPGPEEALHKDLPRPVWGILARGHPKKGHGEALKLWRELNRPGSLVFAGELPDALRREAEADGVLCPGFVAPGPLLRSLDLLLVPSEAEGIPTAMLEAMIRGVPCLATPVGGIPELIEHGETGFLLPLAQWRPFLEQLNEDQRQPIGRAAQQHVRENFSFQAMVNGFVDVAREAGVRTSSIA